MVSRLLLWTQAPGLIDAGLMGLELAPSVGVFLTHYHWDHTQGLSMMDEMWSGACDICVWGTR